MELTTCFADYLRYILHERRLSYNTHKGCQVQLRHFHTWAAMEGCPEPTT